MLLYNGASQVPLLLKLPQSELAGQAVSAPAQLTDVAPTVGALLGWPAIPAWRGVSLLALGNTAERRIYSETFYARLHFGWSELFSLTDGKEHLIDGPDPELYDLAKDAKERENLRDVNRQRLTELRRELEPYDRTLAAPSAVDDETRKSMAALGYLGGGSSLKSGPLPDPKQHLGELADLKLGFDAQHEGDWAKAVAAYRRVLAKNAQMADAWEFLGHALQKTGDRDGALEAYVNALRISNGAAHVAVAAASLYFELERYDEAADHARIAMADNPSFAHGLLAQIALKRGKLDEAEKEARLASADPKADTRIGPLMTLAEVLLAKKQFEPALELTRQAQAAYDQRQGKDPDLIAGLHLLRGRILAEQGQADGAEAEFKQEIAASEDTGLRAPVPALRADRPPGRIGRVAQGHGRRATVAGELSRGGEDPARAKGSTGCLRADGVRTAEVSGQQGIALPAGQRMSHRYPDSPLFYRRLNRVFPRAVRAEGCWIVDEDGKRYLDASGGAMVTSIGQGSDEIAAAIGAQAKSLAYVNGTQFTNAAAEDLAAELASVLPEPLRYSYFLSSGSEAVEAALKLARQFWVERGRSSKWKVIGRVPSYHGNALAALALSGREHYRAAYGPLLLPFPRIAAPDPYRDPRGPATTGEALEDEIARQGSDTVAAFIAEPVIGSSGGAVVPSREYYDRVAETCRRHDVLFIADEVLCGMGRTGRWLASEHFALAPDIVTLGKGLNGGYAPVSAVVATREIVDTLARGSGYFQHAQTYSHSPVACAAGLATIRFMKRRA